MNYLSIFIRVALLALGQSLDCHSASEVSLMDIWENQSMYNHNKAQQSKNRVHISCDILYGRHNEHYGVSNHQPRDCLLTYLFRHRSKKTSKLRVTGLCEGNSPGTGEFPAQKASNAENVENVSIWWRHFEPFESAKRLSPIYQYYILALHMTYPQIHKNKWFTSYTSKCQGALVWLVTGSHWAWHHLLFYLYAILKK